VTPDFAFGSMQQAIQPLVFFHVRFSPLYRYLSFKIKAGNVAASIETIQKKWTQLLPGSSFEYSFMDDTLKKLYATELQLKKAALTSTLLSFIIVLLGVFSLISLSVNKRVKEIGIRKVLGASPSGIVMLFVKEFIIIVLVAAFVACPVAYLIMNNWLNGYAYRINITSVPFALAIGAVALCTLLLIALQTFNSAIQNPVKNLRSE
jgi:ABC-type antimicrobial peptide transport system permease subunit